MPLPGAGAFRTFLEAMARDEDVRRGGVSAYESLDSRSRDSWLAHVEEIARTPGAPLGLALLALFGTETDPNRQRRLLACAAEPPFALRRSLPEATCWQLVRPLGCELASIATVHMAEDGRVVLARYEPLAPIELSGGAEGVALGEAVTVLAHAIVHHAATLRPVLLPFVDLFSPTVRAVETAA